jgi:acyl carrier protein
LAFPQSSDAVGAIEQEASSEGLGPADPLVMELQDIFQDLLDLDCQPAPDTSFFNLGGSSMRASQLASRVRKQHDIPFGGAEVFHFSSCNAIAGVIRDRLAPPGSQGASSLSEVGPASAASSLFFKKLDLRGAPFDPLVDKWAGDFVFQLVPLLLVTQYGSFHGSFFSFGACCLCSRKSRVVTA